MIVEYSRGNHQPGNIMAMMMDANDRAGVTSKVAFDPVPGLVAHESNVVLVW